MVPFDYRPFYKALHEHEWFQTTKYFHGKCAPNWTRPKIIHDFFFQTVQQNVDTPVLFAWLDVSRFLLQGVVSYYANENGQKINIHFEKTSFDTSELVIIMDDQNQIKNF